MHSLNNDLTLHIGSFGSSQEAVSLSHVNKNLLSSSEKSLEEQYKKAFGEIKKSHESDKKILASVLSCAEKQPDASVNHNTYKSPSSRLERWKWIVGVENSLDKEVQKNYNKKISLLENSQATSVVQLKNQLQSFWHADRQMKDYAKFKLDEKNRAAGHLVNRIFFACIGFLFKLYYKPSILSIGQKLESRSRETFAKIGGFNLNSKEYDVVAFHPLADERSKNSVNRYNNDTHRMFNSLSFGKTYIGFFERQQHPSLEALEARHNHNFQVSIGRKVATEPRITSESNISHGELAVLKNKRHLIVGKDLNYRDSTQEVQGSDRLLDQKLTQVMIEMTMQNKNITSLQVESNGNELPVLVAAGFESDSGSVERVMKEITAFRVNLSNKLFPSAKNYGSVSTEFKPQDFTKPSIYYERGVTPQAWSDVIQREAILKPESGILPEYWARKPRMIDG